MKTFIDGLFSVVIALVALSIGATAFVAFLRLLGWLWIKIGLM